jgi:hypothetical protein
MNAKQVNSILWLGTAALGLAAVGSLVFALTWPLEKQESADFRSADPATKPAAANSLPPLASYEKIWNLPLRQPLGTAVPQSAVPVQVATTTPTGEAPPPVALVGTIGNSLAMLKTPANAIEVCAVGDTFNGVTVVAVRPAEIDVRYMGRTLRLSKVPEAQ